MSAAKPTIVIRRKKIVHAHHGGSWKIALADFMTALMALFLVMWILTASNSEQREAVAEYFRTPLVVAMAGGNKSSASTSAIPGGGPDSSFSEGERLRLHKAETSRFNGQQRRFLAQLQRRIEEAISLDPLLRDLRSQLRFDFTLEGLRIQVHDTDQRPMFELGSDQVEPHMREFLYTLAPLLNELPNELSISGHTDSLNYASGSVGYSNWELSSDRANASRRELIAGGLRSDKLLRVSGVADNVPMRDLTHGDPRNRRIELLILYAETAEGIRHPTTDGPMAAAGEGPLTPSAKQTTEAAHAVTAGESNTVSEVL